MRLWGLRSPTAIAELVQVACGTTISAIATPHLFAKLRDNLFVGFAHNLLLESLVSRLAMLEKRHPHTHALTLDAIFNYHMKQAHARELRQSADMRSSTGGARRAAARDKAEDCKALHGTNRIYRQQLALAADALRCASSYTNKELFRIGPNSILKVTYLL